MPDAAWKVAERTVARRLGGKRAGPTGKEGPDVLHALWAIEIKERRRPLPAEIREALAQAARAARPDQLPIVVWHVLGRRHDDDVVMMRLADFEDWAGQLRVEEDRDENHHR